MVDTLTPVTAVTTVLMGVTNFVPLFALLTCTLKILLYIKFLYVTFYVSAYVNFLVVKEWLMVGPIYYGLPYPLFSTD